MPLIHRQGSLFNASVGFLVHSCNAAGEWGGGPQAVATQMRIRFPDAYALYRAAWVKAGGGVWAGTLPALKGVEPLRVGTALVWAQHAALTGVVSLIVSEGYGRQRAPASEILKATAAALDDLFSVAGFRAFDFHSPRLNAGLFGVPWEETEAVIRRATDIYGVNWTVWTL